MICATFCGFRERTGCGSCLSQIMQLASLPKMQGGGHADVLYGTSSARQRSRFGKIASPLRLQMPEI